MVQRGQATVEFALVVIVFLLLMAGLLDGTRAVFLYNQIEEAARAGARWGAVQVARLDNGAAVYGDFTTTPGDMPGTYTDGTCGVSTCYPLSANRTMATSPYSPTIVGAVTGMVKLVKGTDLSVTIATPINTTELTQTNSLVTDQPITVTVRYPFHPILGKLFGGVTLNMQGSSAMLHE
jgi:Flp pilus assembly protein TadG